MGIEKREDSAPPSAADRGLPKSAIEIGGWAARPWVALGLHCPARV